MVRAVAGKCITVSAQREADVRVHSWQQNVDGIVAQVELGGKRRELRSPLIGSFNLENLAVSMGIGLALGLSPAQIVDALESVRGAPGRLERVDCPLGFGVFVDYAHTPDALERVMAAARPLVRGRLLVVFGCGGDRDKTKRPKMGQAAAREADIAVVTSDNPRTEDPTSIVEMILEGVKREPSPLVKLAGLEQAMRGHIAIVDRREAIGAAIAAARPGDVVLIAGKGHEDYQIVGKVKHHFDDREEAAKAIQKLAQDRALRQS
jgi:UDP-N-acetylmuramoyl-L-alanyl-D-glutamate--2,6-diaminopimelate ligase